MKRTALTRSGVTSMPFMAKSKSPRCKPGNQALEVVLHELDAAAQFLFQGGGQIDLEADVAIRGSSGPCRYRARRLRRRRPSGATAGDPLGASAAELLLRRQGSQQQDARGSHHGISHG